MIKAIGYFIIVTWFVLLMSTGFFAVKSYQNEKDLEKQYYRGMYTVCLAQAQDVQGCNMGIQELRENYDLYNKPSPGFTLAHGEWY